MKAPLVGFTVLDVGTMTPGKYCGRMLVELGADVVRIERVTDEPPPVSDEDLVLNQGKRSMTLNLRSSEGRDLFLDLAERADVVLESNRPGTADRHGFGYAAVRERNPRIVYCALSGYGATGPLREAPAYDLIFQARSGMLRALRGANLDAPGTYLADAVAGLTAAHAIVAALLARERGGEGSFIDLAMYESLFALLAVSHGLNKAAKVEQSPLYALYDAADDTQLALAAIRPASSAALFAQLGRPELGGAGADRAEVKSFLAATFLTKRADAWVAELAPLDIEITRVNDPLEAFADPQLAARGMVDRSVHPEAGTLESIQPLAWVEGHRKLDPAPRIGADTGTILRSLGLDDRAIADLAGIDAI